ncbi:hypothetical protein EHS25_005989 [Saitozyma podzolica]|uniref:Phospholipase/carboxylesterase/thioesterase domain-containing protein n=1 Tax=Saitozyma podzolica TaxID=1890683 RepID=A0A427XTX8_9TREE|nr:hypothetical protein EHS25_005989 [Saitozyma podzolica]
MSAPPDTPLNLRLAASSSSAGPRPIPTQSLLKPWTFDYTPSRDGKDLNLLILFHGLGDSKGPFSKLGTSLNLPSTAVLVLNAPLPIPFLESPEHYSWYNTFDPLFNPLPTPDPSPIHLFGWGQGGTVALELAYSIGREGLSSSSSSSVSSTSSASGTGQSDVKRPRRRLGSAVSICAGLLSFPSSDLGLETPVLYFTRQAPKSAVQSKSVNGIKRAFKEVAVLQGDPKAGEAMPRGREEWEGIMRFWGQVLGREDRWKGDGEVFEVVR